MECRVATRFDWEWGPSTLQRLGKAQALRVYIYIYGKSTIYGYLIFIYLGTISEQEIMVLCSMLCRSSPEVALRIHPISISMSVWIIL